jgi:hypothetical protein
MNRSKGEANKRNKKIFSDRCQNKDVRTIGLILADSKRIIKIKQKKEGKD